MTADRRLVIAITGASGVIYGIRALELLRAVPDVETHLILTRGARLTIAHETDKSIDYVNSCADVVHNDGNLGAGLSSGSFRTSGMAVMPCSVKTLSGIANSYAENLVTRAADVTLKERRRLVLMLRETPLHAGHLRLMTQVTESGAVVMPPVPAFYSRPTGINELIDQTVGRCLDLFGIQCDGVKRWTGDPPTRNLRTPVDGTSESGAIAPQETAGALGCPP